MVTVYRGHRRTLFFLPGIIIMCVGIIKNNSLVGGRARADSNPGHWAHHTLLRMAAECVNHSATRAGDPAKSYSTALHQNTSQIYLAAKDSSQIGTTRQLHDKVGNLLNGPLRQWLGTMLGNTRQQLGVLVPAERPVTGRRRHLWWWWRHSRRRENTLMYVIT